MQLESAKHLRIAKVAEQDAPAVPAPVTMPPPGAVEQVGARIQAGEDVRMYVVGSSNVVYETWPDQLHAALLDLGYGVRVEQFRLARDTQPRKKPLCDDDSTFKDLSTPRVGRIGWSSWGFAYESKADCSWSGFRTIAGHRVNCHSGWGCNPRVDNQTPNLVKPSEVAEEARHAHVVVLSNWINDSRQGLTDNACYGHANIDKVATTEITAVTMRNLIHAIHEKNPTAVIVVLARYPEPRKVHVRESSVAVTAAINSAIRTHLQNEPNTIFTNYSFPANEDMFQSGKGPEAGHPNCRGDRVMATSVLEALFGEKVLSRGWQLEDAEECLHAADCGALQQRLGCCRRSALCRVDASGQCVAYGPGV